MAKYTVELVSEIVSNMVANFGGTEVPNAVLKGWLCATYPATFPSGRADGFVEFIACVDFASTMHRQVGASGYAVLRGIKRDRARLWLVPSEVPAIAPKTEAFLQLGAAVPAPLPTKQRKTIRFGEYIAARKGDGEGE